MVMLLLQFTARSSSTDVAYTLGAVAISMCCRTIFTAVSICLALHMRQ